jgi:pyruvate/2-oxoglutarate dehydrogenase complex dihydrolipoamide acyltransferase (E2) component
MIDIHIPKFGMSTVEVDVTEVLVAPGDRVVVGTPLIQIETEKALAVIESEHAGTVVEVLVTVDEVYEVGDVFCRLEPDV